MEHRESPIQGPSSTPARKQQPRLSDIGAETDDDHGRGERESDNGSSRTGGATGKPGGAIRLRLPPHAGTGKAGRNPTPTASGPNP